MLLRQSFQVRYLLETQRDDLALPAFPQSSGRQVALLLVVLGVGPGEFALHDVQGIFIDADPSFEGGETHLVRDDIELPIFYL